MVFNGYLLYVGRWDTYVSIESETVWEQIVVFKCSKTFVYEKIIPKVSIYHAHFIFMSPPSVTGEVAM